MQACTTVSQEHKVAAPMGVSGFEKKGGSPAREFKQHMYTLTICLVTVHVNTGTHF